MRRRWPRLALILALLIALAIGLWLAATQPAPVARPLPAARLELARQQGRQLAQQLLSAPALLHGGAAAVPIEIAAGAPIGGYFGWRTRRASAPGRIEVVAIALAAGERRLVLAGLETVTITPRLRAQISAAGSDLGAPLLPLASHTHSGPGGLGESWLESLFLGASDRRLVQQLAEATVAAARAAIADLQPVQLLDGSAQAAELVVNRSAPGQPIDATVDVVALLGGQGLLGRLVAFGAHPTLVGVRDRIDGDYPARLRSALAGRGDSAPTLFSTAATGSVSGVRPTGQDAAQAMGKRLAAIVDGELALTARENALPLACARVELAMPEPRFPLSTTRVLRRWLSRRLAPPAIGVDVVRIGPVLMLAVPGELSAEVTPTLRQQYARAGLHLVIVSHNGQYAGYFMPAERYLQPGPEAALEIYGPDTADLFVGLLQGIQVGLQIASAEK
ncbi:MAG: hypothetical protein JXR83_23635 [Deltaproteobacteria bacterium]|nr:hypothetical protein [Deltaproteobacteria bacterium]